jgi:hypothetical protein
MARERFLYDKDADQFILAEKWYAKHGYPSRPAFYVIGDIQPYREIATGAGRVIGGRRQHRDYLRENGLVEVGNERIETQRPTLDSPGHDIKRVMEQVGL